MVVKEDLLNKIWPEWQIEEQLGNGTYGTLKELIDKWIHAEEDDYTFELTPALM